MPTPPPIYVSASLALYIASHRQTALRATELAPYYCPAALHSLTTPVAPSGCCLVLSCWGLPAAQRLGFSCAQAVPPPTLRRRLGLSTDPQDFSSISGNVCVNYYYFWEIGTLKTSKNDETNNNIPENAKNAEQNGSVPPEKWLITTQNNLSWRKFLKPAWHCRIAINGPTLLAVDWK